MSTTKTSDTESNNMAVNMIIQKLIAFDFFQLISTTLKRFSSNLLQVELKEENSKHALFRLMPRYKVKAEGDVVRLFIAQSQTTNAMGDSRAVI